jgi:hypothetical protein
VSEWRPIETAPRDGRYLLVTDGERFAAAEPHDYTEPATIGWDGTRYGWPNTERPNPVAGVVHKLWHMVGCSGFSNDADVISEDGWPASGWTPTHWMPLPEPPR